MARHHRRGYGREKGAIMALALKNVAAEDPQEGGGDHSDPLCALLCRVAQADRAAFAELYRLTRS